MANFMTRDSYEKLMIEATQIREKDLPAISKAKLAAAEEGDLSENAEYHACKEKMEQLHARYQNLQSRMASVNFIDDIKIPGHIVSIGTRVTVQDAKSSEEETYIILGSEDADISKQIVSIASPIAKGMIGKKAGETVQIELPEGMRRIKILTIAPFMS